MGASLAVPIWSILPCLADPLRDQCQVGNASCSASSWRSFQGCAIPAGDDLWEPEWLTIRKAKERCSDEALCVGFTFEGFDPESFGKPIWVHFKTAFDCVDADWIAWRKLSVTPAPTPAPSTRLEEEASGKLEDQPVSLAGVALCLLGQVTMLSHTHPALEQHVLEMLQPEVFLYGPKNGQKDPELYGLKDYVVDQKWEDEDIQAALYAETKNVEIIHTDYLQVQGNWFGNQCLDPPMQPQRPGSAICAYYSQNKCLQMIRSKERQRGARYRHVVVSRYDFRWLAPHPPMDMLGDTAVWIPSGSDWEGGMNDRHAVLPRQHAKAYLGAWELLTRGEAVQLMLDSLGSRKVHGYPGPNTENFLLARLRHFEVPIKRFPSVAYLVCTLRSRSRSTECFGTASMDTAGWQYKEEMEHASRIAKCVRYSWTPKKMHDCSEDISHYRGIR